MNRLFALVLAVMMVLSLAACAPAAPVETTPATTTPATTAPAELPSTPVAETPVNFFSLSLGEDYENILSITVYSNEDGTVHVEYVGEVKKVGDLDESIFNDITAALAESGLADLNGQDVWGEGEANGSMYITFTDDSFLSCGFSGDVPQAYRDGYAKMDAFFAQLTASLPEYVPQPMVFGDINEVLLAELNTVITGAGIPNSDAFTISTVEKDESFAYILGLGSDAGIADAAQCAPMMMATAYSLSIVKLEEGADAEAVCADFAANVDWQKWVCVTPTGAMIAVKDDMVICLIGADDLYTMTAAGIEAAGWTVVETLENAI